MLVSHSPKIICQRDNFASISFSLFCQNKVTVVVWVYLWNFGSILFLSMSLFVKVCCFCYCSFVVYNLNWGIVTTIALLFVQDCICYLRSFILLYEFLDWFSFCEEWHWHFAEGSIVYTGWFWCYRHFHNINSANPWKWEV
jgi:hypothetical protein